ncbi:MAG: aspartate-semialdehyde dehydrogenase, partial [Gammaproteobacteria bacterium]
MSRTFDVAVVGATGAVGETMLEILAQRRFPFGEVHALASERSAGSKVSFQGGQLTVQNLTDFDFSRAQIGLFSAGASVSETHAPRAAAA